MLASPLQCLVKRPAFIKAKETVTMTEPTITEAEKEKVYQDMMKILGETGLNAKDVY